MRNSHDVMKSCTCAGQPDHAWTVELARARERRLDHAERDEVEVEVLQHPELVKW
jgi:hypothetical protein